MTAPRLGETSWHEAASSPFIITLNVPAVSPEFTGAKYKSRKLRAQLDFTPCRYKQLSPPCGTAKQSSHYRRRPGLET